MKTVGEPATIPESRLSKRIATSDNAVANEEEIEEQIEEDNVEKEARENAATVQAPIMSNEQMGSADDTVASTEEIEEQTEESCPDNVAFEDGISTVPAEEYIRSRTRP